VKGHHRGDLIDAAVRFSPLILKRLSDPAQGVRGILEILTAILELTEE
jgi:hypothetical protein